MPAWVQESPRGKPQRPIAAVWLSPRTYKIWLKPKASPEIDDVELVLQALAEMAHKYQSDLVGRPARLEVNDVALANALRQDLPDTEVTVASSLPALDEALGEMAAAISPGAPPATLDCDGVTLDHLRRFAAAAAEFALVSPWRALHSDLPVAITSISGEPIDPAFALASVCGGVSGEVGLMFLPSPLTLAEIMRRGRPSNVSDIWSVQFDEAQMLPFADLDAWDAHALPLVAPDRYPMLFQTSGQTGMVRPTAAQLDSATRKRK